MEHEVVNTRPPKTNKLSLVRSCVLGGQANHVDHDIVNAADHIITRSIELYRDQPRELQVEAVLLLVQGRHTFVRVGTGFGKTRISEMNFGLFDKKVVVLVLNPLDLLGDDQVCEKKLLNLTAINLNIDTV
ncbi:hypothetical protein PGTUg99_020651 [Puccinia graminis f. sp. tritici]|uniref:ATP-dependent DNA helicase sgs1 n=1 Tax=Puccinia graminis f. sp. tritici TaxID=56615 RepID=A0A5B0SL07_PUCGR|nr:hypothetical protein PGTUg99_020651 [Puccinia graminis f. sp. tritici]